MDDREKSTLNISTHVPATAAATLETPTKRPRIFYGWFIVGASVAMNAYLAAAFWQGFQVFFLPILNEFGWTRAMISVGFSLRQLESSILALAVGFIVDRWDIRWMILNGILITGAGILLLSQVSSLWTFYLSLTLISIGTSSAAHSITWPTLVTRWFRRKRGTAMGIALLGPAIGAPAVIFVVQLEQALGWRNALFVLGMGVLIIGIPLALVARSRPQDYGLLPDGDQTPPQPGEKAGPPAAAESDIGVREALHSRIFWSLIILFSAQNISLMALISQQIPYFESINFTTEAAASTVSVLFVFSAVGRLGMGRVLDFLQWRLVLTLMMAAQAVALLLLVNVSAYWHGLVFAAIMGISFGGSLPARPILIGRLFGMRSFGSLQGLIMGSSIAAGMVGPVLLGYVFDVHGTYKPAFVGLALLTVAAIFLFYLVHPGRRASPV